MGPKEHLLEVEGVSKHFGGLTAVDNVTYRVGRNEIRGIIGPNGAGKTTFFNVITGDTTSQFGKNLSERQGCYRVSSP